MAPLRRTTETPPRPTSRRGQDSWALITPGLDDSTAPMADECQFFLENVAAKFGCRQASRLDRRSCCVCYPHGPRRDDAQQCVAIQGRPAGPIGCPWKRNGSMQHAGQR